MIDTTLPLDTQIAQLHSGFTILRRKKSVAYLSGPEEWSVDYTDLLRKSFKKSNQEANELVPLGYHILDILDESIEEQKRLLEEFPETRIETIVFMSYQQTIRAYMNSVTEVGNMIQKICSGESVPGGADKLINTLDRIADFLLSDAIDKVAKNTWQ